MSISRSDPSHGKTVPGEGRNRRLVSLADRAVFKLATHWLAAANLFWGLYVGLPLLAPILMGAGWVLPARVIYTIYRPACHQQPTRSYFLGGPQIVYSPEQLAAQGVDTGMFSRDIGNQATGWKMAFCQRDTAIYGSMFVAGLVFALFRRRLGNWQMRFRYFLLFLVPMGIDGVLQLFGAYESTWQLRTLTGVVFGLGAVFFAYPYLEEGFSDIRHTIIRKLHRQSSLERGLERTAY